MDPSLECINSPASLLLCPSPPTFPPPLLYPHPFALPTLGRSKAKAILANAGSGGTPSPAGRKSRPSQQPKFTSPFSGKPLSGKPSMANSGKPSAVNSRSPRSLRDRIIHLLALKPQKRPDIVTRLKKGKLGYAMYRTFFDFFFSRLARAHIVVCRVRWLELELGLGLGFQGGDWGFGGGWGFG